MLGTFNVLEAARLEEANLIFASTNKVYGENVNRIPVIEKETRYEYADPNFREGIPETFPIDLTGAQPIWMLKACSRYLRPRLCIYLRAGRRVKRSS